jgi:hypothetical protein
LEPKVHIFETKSTNIWKKKLQFGAEKVHLVAEKEAILILEPKIQIFVSKSTHFGRKKKQFWAEGQFEVTNLNDQLWTFG